MIQPMLGKMGLTEKRVSSWSKREWNGLMQSESGLAYLGSRVPHIGKQRHWLRPIIMRLMGVMRVQPVLIPMRPGRLTQTVFLAEGKRLGNPIAVQNSGSLARAVHFEI